MSTVEMQARLTELEQEVSQLRDELAKTRADLEAALLLIDREDLEALRRMHAHPVTNDQLRAWAKNSCPSQDVIDEEFDERPW